MNCRECLEFLIDYLEGRLPEEQLEVFQRHLEMCPPCVEYLESYKLTIQLERSCCKHEADAPPKMPEGLVRAILKARKGECGGDRNAGKVE